jgi:hypothetical protein
MKVLEKFMQKSSDRFTFLMQMSGQTLQMNYKTSCFQNGKSWKNDKSK